MGRSPVWYETVREGIRLACADFGGSGSPVVLLHGLAGHAIEWRETASWLTHTHRVIAPEARGHGRSERRPSDVSRDAHVADVEMWLDRFDLGPVGLIGQSLGGHTAFLVAARRPDLVARLVVVEASPQSDPGAPDQVRRWLEQWPVPFPSRAAAVRFFNRNRTWANAWADGLEDRSGELWPRFDLDTMIGSLHDVACTSYWEEWRSVQCPTLVVTAAENTDANVEEMLTEHHAALVTVPDSGHDVHLDNPRAWRHALEDFLVLTERD